MPAGTSTNFTGSSYEFQNNKEEIVKFLVEI